MSNYVQGHTLSILRAHSLRNASNTCQYFIHRLKPNYKILDVGCGPGTVTATLAELVPQGDVIGVDESEVAIKAASEQPDLARNCTFRPANAMSLPFANDTFDVVQTSQVLCHTPDPVAVMNEMRRVCKPGGFVACREGDSEATIVYPKHPGLRLWKSLQSPILQAGGSQDNAGRSLIAWALGAGFAEQNIEYTIGDMTYAQDTREAMGIAMAGRTREDEKWRKNAVATGLVDEKGLETVAEGFEALARDKAGVLCTVNGQVVCVK